MSESPAYIEVSWNGAIWEVATTYTGPVAIGEARDLAEDAGFTLPEPGLVDAIWAAADAKLLPLPRVTDGTPKTMASAQTYEDQAAKHLEQLREHGPFALVAGQFKDVVLVNGKLGLYGWHVAQPRIPEFTGLHKGLPLHLPVTPGLEARVIQPIFTGHGPSWEDYSQGCRLVRRKE